MKDRINIDGTWYVREAPKLDLLFYKGCEFQTEKFLFEFSLGESFYFLKVKGRNDDTDVLLDNEEMIKELPEGHDGWRQVVSDILQDEAEVDNLIEFLKILKQKGWL
jgi:hypothetical protein